MDDREAEKAKAKAEMGKDRVDYSLLQGLQRGAATAQQLDLIRETPEPLDEEVMELLEKLWRLTRKNKDQEREAEQTLIDWTDMLAAKLKVDITKRALKSLLRNEEFFPAPVKFHRAYNDFDYDRNGY